ncbi:VOC family protein [Couchioplanes caeruleus]|uniref:VOC family protein n=1 Tax=Couchioplanes caeruleus TaxID=56438 RepID=UPI0020C08C52|nr:VOC family protein [Couchioplanes caeruleus]UQU62224.1 VOC family protein [Couchioplanes caeruleus]
MDMLDLYRTGTPFLAVADAAAAVAFYRLAFDADVRMLLKAEGRVMHAALLIHGGLVVVVDEMPEVGLFSVDHYGGVPMSILVSCPDADTAVERAQAAGATVLAPVQDSFSGDRHGLIRCPYGYRWVLSTRVRPQSIAETEHRFQAWVAAGGTVGAVPSSNGPRPQVVAEYSAGDRHREG